MATLKPNLNPTMADLMDRIGPDGNIAEIVEMLNETNEMLEDITWVECNNKMSHKTTVRSGLPDVAWRMLNYGVKPSKSQTKQIEDSCGMLESYATIDKKLAEINGMKESWRTSENAGFIEKMNQEFQRALLYGDNTKEPAKILGLTPRFNDKNAENAVNIIDAGGTGTNLTSIWLICWSPRTAHCIYPENSTAGLKEEDLGEQTERDPNGGKYQSLNTHYEWDVGFCVRDWRYIVRIANIDVAALKKDPDEEGGADLIDLMTDAIEKLPNERAGRCAFYCNRTISSFLRKQRRYAKNVNITQEEVAGKKVTAFDGIPVRRCDALVSNEAKYVSK